MDAAIEDQVVNSTPNAAIVCTDTRTAVEKAAGALIKGLEQ